MNFKKMIKNISYIFLLGTFILCNVASSFAMEKTSTPNVIKKGLTGSAFSGGSYYNQLDSTSQTVYNNIYNAYASGPSDKEIKLTISYKMTVNLMQTSEGLTLSDDAKVSIDDTLLRFMNDAVAPAYLALTYDHPEMSWISNASYGYYYSVSDSDYSNINVDSMTATLTATNFTFRFNDVYKDCGDAASINAAINKAVSDMSPAMNKATTDYEKLFIIHDYLCDTITYNQSISDDYFSDSIRFYNTAYSAFYGSNGSRKITTVCAGYAKAFKLLCNYYGYTCILVSGTANNQGKYAPHMWNYVKLDGNWYAVDVTWDDQDEKMFDDFFLVGANSVPEHFKKEPFSVSHQPESSWGSAGYNFNYPTLASNDYNPDASTDNQDNTQNQNTTSNDTNTSTSNQTNNGSTTENQTTQNNNSNHHSSNVVEYPSTSATIESQIQTPTTEYYYESEPKKDKNEFAIVVVVLTATAAGIIICLSFHRK